MKLLPFFAFFTIGSARADDTAPSWPHVPAETLLASIPAGKMPSAPEWIHVPSPTRAVILHGDLFGDGRHLALVGSDDTTLAVGSGDGWKILKSYAVCPAWESPDKSPLDAGNSRGHPAANPFTLTDLDGDKVPEVLIDTYYNRYHTGCRIARKEGEDLKLLDITSVRRLPKIKEGLMQVVTGSSGNKAWWSVHTYYQWKEGTPVPLARWSEDARNPELNHWLAERIHPDGSATSFSVLTNPENSHEWQVARCTWKSGVETENEQAFAKLTFTEGGQMVEEYDKIEPVLFEVLTGLPATAFEFDHAAKEADLKNIRVQVDGSDEARKLLKRINP